MLSITLVIYPEFDYGRIILYGVSKLKSNAPGQLLGYTLQYPRALYHLLRLPIDGYVCVEVLGDVASVYDDNYTILEEDKSSISSYPLTNKSVDLWKTFYNWIKAVNNNELNVNNSKFILYCNKNGRKGLVNQFNDFTKYSSGPDLLANIKKVLLDINSKHEIWKHYDFVINKNFECFIEVIKNFELHIGKDSSFKELRLAVKEKIVEDNLIDYLIKILSGWLQFKIMEMIRIKKNVIITFEEFEKEFLIAFKKVRTDSLIDWATEPLSNNDISDHINQQPNYIQQLDLISNDKLIEAVSDYIKADINRSKWIETGVLDEVSALDFENRLKSYYDNIGDEINIVHGSLDDEKKGQLLFSKCKSRKERINNLDPPDRTIPGTYHELSDRKEIGWHPNWENLMNKEEG